MHRNRFRQILQIICHTVFFLSLITNIPCASDPGWVPKNGSLSMSVYGAVYVDNQKIENSGFVIAAFGPGGDSDCRDRANIIQYYGEWFYSLYITADIEEETISFKIWDSNTDQIYTLSDTIIFASWTALNRNLGATLRIDSVYPTIGEFGKNLEVKIKGSGFDERTHIVLYPDITNRNAIIGSVDTLGDADNITVIHDYAYVTGDYFKDGVGFTNALLIINISDPENPAIIGSADTLDTVFGFTVVGDYAYVTGTYFESREAYNVLLIINISDPENPAITGSVNIVGRGEDIMVIGNYAYVVSPWVLDINGTDFSSLNVIDIREPENPVIIHSFNTWGNAYGVTICENTAYIADYNGSFRIIDITDPENPVAKGAVNTPDSAYDVTVAGDYAYVADYDSGLQIIDISDRTNPVIIGSVDTPGLAQAVTVIDNTAYVADYDSGLQIIDINDRTNPVIIGSVDTPGSATAVTVIDNSAYVADGLGGIQVIDISQPAPVMLALISSVTTLNHFNDFTAVDDNIFVVCGFYHDYGTLHVIDIQDPENPAIIGSMNTSGGGYAVTVTDNTAYVADSNRGLHIIDIFDPKNPAIIGSVDTPGDAMAVTVADDYAYVADSHKGLQVVNISNPEDPVIIASVDTPDIAGAVTVVGDTAYVADYDSGLQIIDMNDRVNPVIIGSVNTLGGACDVSVVGDSAYVANYNSDFQVIDISDRTNPVIITSVDTPDGAYDITVVGEYVYVAAGESGVQMIDISVPQNPLLIASIDTPRGAYNVKYDRNMIFVQNSSNLLILPAPVLIDRSEDYTENSISLTIPSPQAPGRYILRVYNEDDGYKMSGAVSFMKTEDYIDQKGKKAIIAAGTLNYPDDSLWKDTQFCTRHAYLSLFSQGYTHERIKFFSPENTDVDGDGKLNDIDGQATAANLSEAVQNWAKDANELLLYITDHGGTEVFHINENETLSAETLDEWLDELQTVMSGKIIIIYDACMSGSFISKLAGHNRILVTSAGSGERAWFMNGGMLSFSYQFWSSIYSNAYLYTSFERAMRMMEGEQTCLLDADGNGIPNEKTDKEAIRYFMIGRGRVAASVPPVIGWISEDQTLMDTNEATVRIGDIETSEEITRVWAVITPPGTGNVSPEKPVNDLPVIEMTDSDGDGIYEFTYTHFEEHGTYTVNVYVTDSLDTLSVPLQNHIIQPCGRGNINRDDAVDLKDAIMVLKILAGVEELPDGIYLCADADSNEKIGMEEAIHILRKLSHL